MAKKTSRFPFTEARVRDLPVPAEDRAWHYDTKVAGLCVCKMPSGRVSFYYYRWLNGRPSRTFLGRWPELSVVQARDAAEAAVGMVAQGKDPQDERRRQRVQPTVEQLWQHWLIYANAHKRPNSVHEDVLKYDRFLSPWASRRLSTITKAEVQAMHGRIGRENGTYQANRVLALLRAMLNKAEEIGYQGSNPAARVKLFKEQSRDRFLQADELKRFFEALAGELPLFRDFFLVALLTGARRGNVQAMRWEDVNFDLAVWRIPETKSGVPIIVPLVAPVVEVLRSRLAEADGSPWVFPGRRGGHLAEPRFAWNRIVKAAGLSDIRPHDLRRSLGSWMAGANVSLPIIGRVLGHSTPQATMIYSRLSMDPLRDAVERATTAMLTAGGQTKLLGIEPGGDRNNGGSGDG